MFNRLLRCALRAKTPLSINPSHSILPSLSNPLKSSLLSSRISFCSVVAGGEPADPIKVIKAKKTGITKTPDEMAEADLKNLTESDPTVDKRYKILQLEVDVMRHTGKQVPDKLKAHHWLQLLNSESRSQRRKYLQFLFLTEKKQENYKKKKQLARIEREKLKELEPEGEESPYRLHKVTMFMRIYDTTMHNFYHTRLIHAMMFGPKVIIDCGYYAQMTPRECTECAKQLAYMFAENRVHPEPFDLHFCNVNKSSLLMQKLHRMIPPLYEPSFPINISEESYTEIFDKSKLVYLTPDCNNEMNDFEPDSLYIIGGIVDKTNSEPLSLARAKKEGLRMAKLPLDKYLLWGSGSGKRLTLNQMVNILTDVRVTRDWKYALRHVPRRKLEKPIEALNSNKNSISNWVLKERSQKEIQNGPFRPSEEKIQSSFSFKNRQKRSYNE